VGNGGGGDIAGGIGSHSGRGDYRRAVAATENGDSCGNGGNGNIAVTEAGADGDVDSLAQNGGMHALRCGLLRWLQLRQG